MLELADHWVWDSWTVHDGTHHHLFFLRASRALLDPERRHHRASIGHARSLDLRSWELLPDALVAADAPAWDDLATWTGSVVADPAGGWRMFYTGIGRARGDRVQRIGVATSTDLVTWHRQDGVVEADGRWYEKYDAAADNAEPWRDPFVLADPDGDGWHMLLTASAAGTGPGRGVVGHATSPDLRTWTVRAPLSAGAGFGMLEVPQVAVVAGAPVLLFSCWPHEVVPHRRPEGRRGVWVAPGESLLGPWDLDAATVLDHDSLYAARLVGDDRAGWSLLGFLDTQDGAFVGAVSDPLPVARSGAVLRLGAPGLRG